MHALLQYRGDAASSEVDQHLTLLQINLVDSCVNFTLIAILHVWLHDSIELYTTLTAICTIHLLCLQHVTFIHLNWVVMC